MSRGHGTALRTVAQYAIIDLREQLGLSQEGLARALNTSVRTVARWEGETFPHGRLLQRLEQFAAKRNLPDHAAQFHRMLQQEQFLESNRKFFFTGEGLDLQVAIVKIRELQDDPKVAEHWAKAVSGLARGVWVALKSPQLKTAGIWEVEEFFDLSERLMQYAKEAQKKARELQKKTAKQQQTKPITIPKKRKPA